jgi:hypothetical protein
MGFLLVAALGCGGDKVVPVSGTISLNGKPLPDAYVVFESVEGDASKNATGVTDDDGVYSLAIADGREGCRVGAHRVMMTTVPPDAMDDERTPLPKDKIPQRYQTKPLTFDVPPEGTQDADFELKR